MAVGFHHNRVLQEGDRVTVRLSDGFVGKATVVKHYRSDGRTDGYMHVRYDDKRRHVRTIDDWLATPLETLDLLAEIE